MNTTPNYNDTLDRFVTSPDYDQFLDTAAKAGANGLPSWVLIHSDGTWSFRDQDAGYSFLDIPLLIYWSVKPEDPKAELKKSLKWQLENLSKINQNNQ